jgi:hydrogenase maturation protein HypF
MTLSLNSGEQQNPALSARQIMLSGQVQGVGFRPFIYRLALEHQLTGWVRNCVGVVEIHVQGQAQDLHHFLNDIFEKKPPLARPQLVSDEPTAICDYTAFSILQSEHQGEAQISVPSDLFLCDDCLAELNDPSDRRYRYPFINCTQCGPRYTLIRRLPYDRPNTTMADFKLCPLCRAEYEDPNNRRFHAEPVACPACGPALSFHLKTVDAEENVVNDNETSLQKAIDILRQGKTIAVKGIGGYHLMCDASDNEAVRRLREHKPRPHKPLAIMFPAPADNPFRFAEAAVRLNEQDKKFLLQPARPILLLQKNTATNKLSELIAPGLNEIGIMLPYSPLHHLLLDGFGGALVATSANISGEPVLIDNADVEKRLGHVTDAYLHHNRPIERPADDPVFRTIAKRPRPIRTGRGAAPIELTLPFELEQPVLAVGAHMKNTITLAWHNRAVISPHIGEMDSARSLAVFENTIDDLQKLYEIKAEQIVCDFHPGYTTTRWAKKQKLPLYQVYHHHAHASAAYHECRTEKDIMAVTWDGVGYGADGTLWGGETFTGRPGAWQRIASMRPFHLPGGDKAGREPWRSAAALCWETEQPYPGIPEHDPLLKQAWQKKINTPRSTSVGRMFDAAAALSGVCAFASFEGQGPMELEALCNSLDDPDNYISLPVLNTDGLLLTDWSPLLKELLDAGLKASEKASLFHRSMADAILQQALKIRSQCGINIVSLCGGVFQNRVLTESATALLSAESFEVCLPELIPVNDAGISFGQVIEYGFK